MDFLPVFLNILDRPCTVVGGGEVAARKVALLLRAGARVTVYAPELCDALTELARAGGIVHRVERFHDEALAGSVLAVAATDDEEVNRRVSQAARRHARFRSTSDRPGLCTFIIPSIVDRSPVLVAVSSGGSSPVLHACARASRL